MRRFVETKKARLDKGTKASHLAYLGDATLGDDVSVGTGTITCNYDGVDKHPTAIGRGRQRNIEGWNPPAKRKDTSKNPSEER